MQDEMTDSASQTTQLDESAVTAVRGGDAERYRELVERHERRVYAVAWSRLGDAALAEEVTQEAFIRAYRRLWLLGDGAKFSGWINTITRRVAINFGLRHRRELNKRERWALENYSETAAENSPTENESLHSPETLRQTLAELPAAHRECLVLFYLEGKSGAEAAAALGISETTLHVRLHRARAALRERLEEKLEGSLTKLRPAKTLVPAVMASVLASSKVATGGGTALLGVLVKLSPFKWLLPFFAAGIGALPAMAMSAAAARAEQRNYRDPEGFRAQASRAMHRRILWVVPLTVIPMVGGILMLMSKLGQNTTHVILAVFMIGIFVLFWMTQHNRFQNGMMIWYAMLAGGMVLMATGLISPDTNTLIFVAANVWLMQVVKKQPRRMDTSLFFRAGLGMLELPADATTTNISAPRLEKSDLMRFARFLGDRWLVNDYRWLPEGLLLRQKFIKPMNINKTGVIPFLVHRDSSNILLAWNGEVTALQREKNEHEPIGEVAVRQAQLESQVATAVKFAWKEFRNGNLPAVEKALGEKPEGEIFVVPPVRSASTRWQQASLALVVVLFSTMFVLGRLPKIIEAVKVLFPR
jgi:RNA polymerase sigma-70 factor (ECF subfamily)